MKTHALAVAVAIVLLAVSGCNQTTTPETGSPSYGKLLLGTDSGIVEVDPATGAKRPLGFGDQYFAYRDGKVYVPKSVTADDELYVYDLEGNLLNTIHHDAFTTIGIVAIDDARIALLDNRADMVRFINTTGSTIKEVAIADAADHVLQNMSGIVVDNKLIISEDGHKKVFTINLDSYQITTVADLSAEADVWLASIAYANGVYYTGDNLKRVFAFREGGHDVRVLTTLPDGAAGGLLYGNNVIYAATYSGGTLYHIDPDSGELTVIATGFSRPASLQGIPLDH